VNLKPDPIKASAAGYWNQSASGLRPQTRRGRGRHSKANASFLVALFVCLPVGVFAQSDPSHDDVAVFNQPSAAHVWNGGSAAVAGGVPRLSPSACPRDPRHCVRWLATLDRPPVAQLAQPSPRQSWIARHPVIFGTLVGFGSGFLVGLAGGDDGVFDDFTAEFNGIVVGGIGAGIGAAVGAAVSAASK
jgi:hypothetical protein